MSPPPLFDSSAVHAPSRVASWLALALSAGAVNAIALAACSRYVTHVTGTLTRIGIDALSWPLVFEYLLVLGAFVLGAASSVGLSEGRRLRGLPPRPWAPLALTASLLALAGALGSLGVFGDFGAGVERPGDFAFLAVLAFGMGLQNAAVATATGMLVRTTHMTGPATDLGVALGTLAHDVPSPLREAARRSAALRGGKMIAFAIGAGLGIALAGTLGYAALVVPAVVIAGVAATTFALTLPADALRLERA
ncbi:YoaK family protein [Sandaracinus amylolyticus]|uniref:Putative transmembrane protein n=1 Tax=Sandaracinus amylolyticus TaxID=927083 RepID=A0A0F6SH33_9BACT|nr:YoaK family protein [Sandaracinus amylolyticus]AKF09744.1 Putative transmembrane protein [Sandaracinus amylolyticus]